MSATAVHEEVVPFTAGDGVELNLVHPRAEREPTRGPVLLVHGAGVRARIFQPPTPRPLVDVLLDEGFDVWLLNWRASIDVPHNRWTLDQAAAFDHPRAVEEVVARTGADEIKAIVHCQGSTSFVMAAVAGLVPQVRTIVSNAVSLHPVVPRMGELKLRFAIPAAARALGYLDPQWGRTGAPWVLPKLLHGFVRATHHECDNDVCRMASFVYGVGFPTLWRHENLDDATHDWISQEFAQVPLTFFQQILACVRAGHLVSLGDDARLPPSFVAEPPRTDARFVLMTGDRNGCFAPESQARTHAWLERHAPGRHALHVVPGYGHLDVFLGRHADRDVFPLIVDALEEEPSR